MNRFARILGRFSPESVKVLSNTGWLFFGRVLRMAISLFVGTWIARYLEPESFGTLQYSLAFASFFAPLSTAQMGPVITRDLVRNPGHSPGLLGTAFVLQLGGGIMAMALCIAAASWFMTDQQLQILVAIAALKFIFNSLQPIENWFESRVASKFAVFAEYWAFLIIVLAKAGLVISQAAVVAFAIAIVTESLLYGVGLLVFYQRQGQTVRKWHTDWLQMQYLFRESLPLLLSSTACVIYLNIDQVMLGQMVDNYAVGIYASAATLSGATSFISVIVCSSLYPSIIQARELGKGAYHQRLQRFYDLNSGLAYGLIVLLVPGSGWLITQLYGTSYQAAVPIFAVHIWSGLFTFLGIAQSKWIVSEGLQTFNFYSRLSGLVANVGLNLWLIPLLGIMGAAIATLISYALGGYLFFWLLPATRENARLLTKALVLPLRPRAWLDLIRLTP